jgi:uncharacterized membrane protein YfcA
MDEVVRHSWYWLLLIGLAGGTVSGALGIGSGVLVVPALVLGMGFTQKVAQGTCLSVMVPMALMGALRYHWNPDIKISMAVILVLVPCAVIGANIGSSIAAWLPATVLRRVFGVFVIVVGVKMLWPKV